MVPRSSHLPITCPGSHVKQFSFYHPRCSLLWYRLSYLSGITLLEYEGIYIESVCPPQAFFHF